MRLAPLELVIFDCDGVLVDSERLTVEIEARTLGEMGWPITVEEVVRRFVGRSSDDMLREVEQHLGVERTLEFDRVSTEAIVAAFRTRLQPVDGVRALIDRLQARGVLTCVASSGSHRKMELTLGLTGLASLFDGRIFSSSEVARGKPWPDLFLHAAAGMGVGVDGCVVIEDSANGVRAAVAAGMTCFGFAGGLTRREDLVEAGAIVFDTMDELQLRLTAS